MDDNGRDSIIVNRFMGDLGPRTEDNERTTQRYVAGITGVVFEDWDLDSYLIYGKTDLERVNKNNLIRSRFKNAYNAVKLDDGSIVCADEKARAEGCVPVDLFGHGAVTPEAAAYFSTTSVGEATVEQTVIGFNVANGFLFEVPAGDVGFAAGVEYRKEEMETKEDELAATGDTFFNAFPNEASDFDVYEGFAEITIPLLTDLPGVEDLRLDAAARVADYSTVGNTTSWKVGLDWIINDELKVRATYATALRAPNLDEFYGAPSQNFFRVTDSCKAKELDDLAPDQRAIRAANCAALGVPADFDSDYDQSSIKGVNQGNNKLEPEESDSYTIGLAYQSSLIESLAVTIDYWNIEITDAISGIGAQNIVDRCVDNASGINNEYCALLTRDPNTHQITNLINTSTNVAKQEASGLDFEISHDAEIMQGDLKTALIATYLIERNEYPFQDDPTNKEQFAGTVGESKWQANLTFNYAIADWNVNWKTRYLSRVDVYTPQKRDDYSVPYTDVMQWGSYVSHDFVIDRSFDNGIKVGFGVDNVFDRGLPSFTTNGTGVSSASYDNVGRFYYLTFDYSI